jgi:hypothetical protein
MATVVMSDAELAACVARTDHFVAALRELIAATRFDPDVRDCNAHRRALERIGATFDAVDYVTLTNLATIDLATRGMVLSMLRVKLLCLGAAPELDYPDAATFFDELYRPAFDLVKRRY